MKIEQSMGGAVTIESRGRKSATRKKKRNMQLAPIVLCAWLLYGPSGNGGWRLNQAFTSGAGCEKMQNFGDNWQRGFRCLPDHIPPGPYLGRSDVLITK
jgi:hypothetical protein